MRQRGGERHRTGRVGWLRAAVLGADDGILSTASLILELPRRTAVAGMFSSQVSPVWSPGLCRWPPASTCRYDRKRTPSRRIFKLERSELGTDDQFEHQELEAIYVGRGLDPALAKQVADQLMAYDALGAHARDELGISETLKARPMQAALASAASFSAGAAMPLLVAAAAPQAGLTTFVAAASLLFLAILGALAARVGGANVAIGAIRVLFWGAVAMGVTAGVGALFGAVV